MTSKEMSHLLKRTKKSCLKLIRKLSTKQIFLKRLEEEDISKDIDISIEAKERNNNESENSSPKNSSYHHGQTKKENEDAKEKNKENGKLINHRQEDDEDEEEESHNTAVLQSLTQKLFLTADGYEFQRLEQLRSDTASEIVPYDYYYTNANADAAATKKPTFADDTNIEVVFEKVKYKEDVRYLRHTPSTASLDNYTINEDIDYYITNSITIINNTTTTTNFAHNNNCNMPNLNESFLTNRGLETHRNYFNSQNHLNTNLLPVNVSLGCKTDGNYHQFIIGEERDCFHKLTPVVRWDINGNSLEDDFDNFHQLNINAFNSPSKSSLRSSSTTLETWLDDE